MKKTNSSLKSQEMDAPKAKRNYVKQSDVPSATLSEALRVPQVIVEQYASKASNPIYVAKALGIDPKGSQFKTLTGAAIAFGLTEGGAQAPQISLTDLGKRILKPKSEGEDIQAKRQAMITPRIFKDFLTQYDGSACPRQDIALNVLEDLGVPTDKAEEVFNRIIDSAREVGFIEVIKGKNYIIMNGTNISTDNDSTEVEDSHTDIPQDKTHIQIPTSSVNSGISQDEAELERRKKVFITHGKNNEFVEPIKKLLEFGEFIPIVSAQRQSVSKPVPEKVMDDMRNCGAAIIHVEAEQTITDGKGEEHVLINSNVLIEIGAAMAFYGRRFILLVRDGIKLPSNLQGLYEVRYTADILDATATIKLLEAIKDIKKYALPALKQLP